MEVCQAFPRPPHGFQAFLIISLLVPDLQLGDAETGAFDPKVDLSLQRGIFIPKTIWMGSRPDLLELERQTPYVMLEGFAHIVNSV